MPEQYLQAAFEIKAMCDELSRRLLRWHWEKQRGLTLRQLMEYIARRTEQAPDYYGRIPAPDSKGSWQQLDTTVCMRVLLDPGDGEEGQPLRLLSDAPRPVGARHACNGLRIARNAAAHATELEGAAEAAARFSQAVEDLADCYGEEAFTAAELEKYRRAAARAVKQCAGAAQAAPEEAADPAAGAAKNARAKGSKSGAKQGGQGKATAGKTPSAAKSRASRGGNGGGAAAAKSRRTGRGRKPSARRRRLGGLERLFLALGAVVVLTALWLRARALGLL